MKANLLLAATLAASVSAAAIEARQRPTGRPGGGNPGGPDVGECGLDSFAGHTAEASLFCSSILRSGTSTSTQTYTTRPTVTTRKTITATVVVSTTPAPPPPPPPTSSARPSSSPTPVPPPPSTPVSTPSAPSSTPPAPSSTPGSGCGIVGYTKSTAAYYFDSSGTKNNFTACSTFCKADSKCKSFGYGEANCMLFDVPAADNVNRNPMSPYTFYDASCPSELPVKRQVNISLNLPGGNGPKDISSACSCLITSGPAGATKTTTITITNREITKTETVTTTITVGG